MYAVTCVYQYMKVAGCTALKILGCFKLQHFLSNSDYHRLSLTTSNK